MIRAIALYLFVRLPQNVQLHLMIQWARNNGQMALLLVNDTELLLARYARYTPELQKHLHGLDVIHDEALRMKRLRGLH